MRAALVETCGHPPVVRERDRPAADLVVDVVAAPITPLDLLCASGTSYFGTPATPYVPGVQGVGTLDGRTVWFASSAGMAPGDGSMAAATAVAADDVVPLPDGVEPVAMAALGLSAVAAHEALRAGGLREGETVVVLGASGVVGQAAIQLARLGGAGRIVAASRAAGWQERAQEQGADVVVVLDDADDGDDLAARLAEATDGAADLVLDPLYGAPAAAAATCLRPGGRLVNLGSSAGEHATIGSSLLRSRSLHVLGYTNNALTVEQRAAAIGAVASYSREGRLSVAHEVVPLDDVTDAWTRQAEGRTSGRVVLTTH